MEGDVRYGDAYMAAGEGPAVVMIPGMEGCKEIWTHQFEALRGDHRVVATDLLRQKPKRSSSMSGYADHVLDIMDEVGIEKAVIVGESFGGVVAQEIATAHPERLEGLVLCNTMDRARRGGFGFNMFTLATFVHFFAFLPFLKERHRRAILRWVGKHRGFILDPSPGNEALIEYVFKYGTAHGAGSYIDRVIAGGRARYTDRLSGISVPTLYLRGAEDRLVYYDSAVEITGRIRGAEIGLVQGGGHICMYTVPEATNDVLLEWFSRKGL